MKVKDVRAGDVFINPVDRRCIYLLTYIVWDLEGRASYGWFSLGTGDLQDMVEALGADDPIAPEWMILRGGVIMQESELTEDWKDILEVAA